MCETTVLVHARKIFRAAGKNPQDGLAADGRLTRSASRNRHRRVPSESRLVVRGAGDPAWL